MALAPALDALDFDLPPSVKRRDVGLLLLDVLLSVKGELRQVLLRLSEHGGRADVTPICATSDSRDQLSQLQLGLALACGQASKATANTLLKRLHG